MHVQDQRDPLHPRPMHSTFGLYSNSSTSRIGGLLTCLSGRFAHTFSTSSTDLSLPNILAEHTSASSSRNNSINDGSTASPDKITGPATLIAATTYGKDTLDKAMQYLLDSDDVPDKCTDPVWLMRVMHLGWELPPSVPTSPTTKGAGFSGSLMDPSVGGRYKQESKSGRGCAGSWWSSSSFVVSSIEAHSLLSSSTNSHSGHGSAGGRTAPASGAH